MNGQNEENLGELFARFVDTEQAEKAAEDVRKAERILYEYPAPEPDEELIAGIKAQITGSLLLRRRGIFRRKVSYEVAAVAAAVIVLAAIWTGIFEKEGGKPRVMYASIIPATLWESDNITVDDPRIASLTAEVEQVESDVRTLQEGETGGNGSQAVSELEVELAVINSSL